MKKIYNRPTMVIQNVCTAYLMATSTAQGAGLGADIVYGGEDEDGSIVPAVKSNSVNWSEWE